MQQASQVIQSIKDEAVREHMQAFFLEYSVVSEIDQEDQSHGEFSLNVDSTCLLFFLGADPTLIIDEDGTTVKDTIKECGHWLAWSVMRYRSQLLGLPVHEFSTRRYNMAANSEINPMQAIAESDSLSLFRSLRARPDVCSSLWGAELLRRAVVRECDDRDAGRTRFSDHSWNIPFVRACLDLTLVMVVLGADPDAPGPDGSAAEIALKRDHWLATMLFEWRKKLMASQSSRPG